MRKLLSAAILLAFAGAAGNGSAQSQTPPSGAPPSGTPPVGAPAPGSATSQDNGPQVDVIQPGRSTLSTPGNTKAVGTNEEQNRDPPLAGRNSFTEKEARKRIAKEGYTDISKLTKDKESVWRGDATREGRRYHVALDYHGNVTAEAGP